MHPSFSSRDQYQPQPRVPQYYRATPVVPSFLRDVVAGLRDDDGQTALVIAAQEAKAQYQNYLEELDGAYWLHPGMREVLRDGQPDRVLHALRHEEWGLNFLENASPSLFEGTLKLIPPSHFLAPYRANYLQFLQKKDPDRIVNLREVKVRPQVDSKVKGLYRVYTNLQDRFDNFSNNVDIILRQRRHFQHPLTLEEFVYLLEVAREMGDGDLADATFYEMSAVVEPDLRCYNHYMAAKVWANAWDFYERDSRYVTRRMLSLRQEEKRRIGFTGHRVGENGIRKQIIQVLHEMTDRGFEATCETFSHVIVAMGREGDLDGVKNVLRSIWRIDLDLLQQYDEDELDTTPNYFDRASPLRPTPSFLFSVAHAFCINREPLLALTAVDYISRLYDMQIPFEVWQELLEAMLLKTIRRRWKKVDPERHIGTIPYSTFEDFWSIMLDQPHNVEPCETMHLFKAKAALRTIQTKQLFDSIGTAVKMLDNAECEAYTLLNDFLDLCEDLAASTDFVENTMCIPAIWFDMRNEIIQVQMQLDAVLNRIFVTIVQILRSRAVPKTQEAYAWERVVIPKMVMVFEEFLPNDVRFRTTGGEAVIHGLRRDRNKILDRKAGRIRTYLGLLRLGIDDVPYDALISNIRTIAESRIAFSPICFHCGQRDHPTVLCQSPRRTKTPGKPPRSLDRAAEENLRNQVEEKFAASSRYVLSGEDDDLDPKYWEDGAMLGDEEGEHT
ncbi:hypothetical protein UCRPC4_g03855 [Phaeomoniella chlamydospora]|uniref:Uncharacterized protein n=1 Tax=Phaeomoniella chlamydospora TaxID=158046 RepID=A0A0G2EFC9_PHACM|nr:hypothetical protein UCRPC4_g03855 [Phaeomoniella chlamydospora]